MSLLDTIVAVFLLVHLIAGAWIAYSAHVKREQDKKENLTFRPKDEE